MKRAPFCTCEMIPSASSRKSTMEIVFIEARGHVKLKFNLKHGEERIKVWEARSGDTADDRGAKELREANGKLLPQANGSREARVVRTHIRHFAFLNGILPDRGAGHGAPLLLVLERISFGGRAAEVELL